MIALTAMLAEDGIASELPRVENRCSYARQSVDRGGANHRLATVATRIVAMLARASTLRADN